MVSKVQPVKIDDDDEAVPIPAEFSSTDYAAIKGVALENSDSTLIDLSSSNYVQFKDVRFTSPIQLKNIFRYGFSFSTASHNSSGFLTISSFAFPGTSVTGVSPSKVRIIAYVQSGGDEGEFRLYDKTNSLQICLITFTATAETIYSTTSISNIPSGEAIFDFQIRKSVGTGNSKVFLNFVGISWE